MAPSTPIGSLTEHLVLSLAAHDTAPVKLRRLKDAFSRRIAHHNYARTNQFEVAERLEGLQEKFIVLNQDDLADALRARLLNLSDHSDPWLPDVLDLLLRLSGNPLRKNLGVTSEDSQLKPEPEQELKWAEIERDDSINRKAQIWEQPEFSDLSSDEDPYLTDSDQASPGDLASRSGNIRDVPRGALWLKDREDAIDDELRQGAFSRSQSSTSMLDGAISEAQLIREVLFMLQGLPTSIYRREGPSILVKRNPVVDHVSSESLRGVLSSFARLGEHIDVVRTWLRDPQQGLYMQVLQSLFLQRIAEFDVHLSELHSLYLCPKGPTVVSMVSVLQDLNARSQIILQISRFLRKIGMSQPDAIDYLEGLFTTTCSLQAVGDHESFDYFRTAFLTCFNLYLRPVVHWVKTGEIDRRSGTIFISKNGHAANLSNLWQDWYRLEYSSGPARAPEFIHSVVDNIFSAGKTAAFLHFLQTPATTMTELPSLDLQMAEMGTDPRHSLPPFSQGFRTALNRTFGQAHTLLSRLLKEKLETEGRFSHTLHALREIFLASSGWLTDAIDEKLFSRIDRGIPSWNDRFLLTELFQTALAPVATVEVHRIAVQSRHGSSRDMESRRRSVKILNDISVNYVLPWWFANIVSEEDLATYRRISLLLMQIRRAKYMLERRCQHELKSWSVERTVSQHNIALKLHQRLLHFLNVLYHHLTSFVIEGGAMKLDGSIVVTKDVDEMIGLHRKFILTLEQACLLSPNLRQIKDSIISVLDLSVRFADILSSHVGQRSSDFETSSYISAMSRRHSRSSKRPTSRDSDDEDDEDDDLNDDQEGFSTFVTFDETSFDEQLQDVHVQAHRQLSFILAGLRSISRKANEIYGWEVLAERLGWHQKDDNKISVL
jgi:gamma-tubulin complex component 5